MKNRFTKILSVGLLVASLGFVGSGVLALAHSSFVQADTTSEIKGGVDGSGGSDPKNAGNRLPIVIRTVVNILLFIIGAFAVIMIIIAGFRLVTANGDATTVSSARNTVLYAVIGLVVAFLAYALVNFVVSQFK